MPPEASTPVEGEQNTASDEECIYTAVSIAARINSFNEETQRRRQLLRSSALQSQESEVDRLLAPSRALTEQNQTRDTDNTSVPLVGALGTPALPIFSELASDYEREIDFMPVGPREVLGRQPNTSAYLPSFRSAYSPSSLANLDAFPDDVIFHQGASEDDLIDERAPLHYNIPVSRSPEPFASGAIPALLPSYESQRSNTPPVHQMSHRDELRELEPDLAILRDANRLLRDESIESRQGRYRQSLILIPSMAPTNNSDSPHMLPQLIPSVQFYPAGGIRRPEDNLNRPALESGVGEINQFAGTGSSTADRDDTDVDGVMVEHVEDTRNHRLSRYYELMEAYSHIVHRWCLQVHHQVINHAHGIRLPASSLERLPTIRSTFWDIGRHLLSQDHHRITTAVQRIQNFLLRWSEHRGPIHRILQPIAEATLLEQFAQLLLQEGMEQERMVWEPVVQLHTGRRLDALLLAYENLRFVSQQRINATNPLEESTDEEDEDGIDMDVVDGIRPYRHFE